MQREKTASTADVIYIWRAVGWSFDEKPVYKIGLTSKRSDQERIDYVTKSAQCEAEIVLMVEVSAGSAFVIEGELLKMGINPKYSGFNGCTEFRALSDEELCAAITFATKKAVCESSAQ
jgi:hypothetical protein